MHTISKNRFGEWSIVKWWYTKKKGMTIEDVIDKDIDWFLWAVCTFQNITPSQAEYFKKKTGKTLNPLVIQDVEPYEYMKGDPTEMYMEICRSQDLHGTIRKWRGKKCYYFSIMSATEDWLRYIENRVMHDRYGMNGYRDDSIDDEKSEEDTKESDNV